MNKPWDKFVRATGKTEELCARARQLACEFVERQFEKLPSEIIIGEDWLVELRAPVTSFWFGDFGVEAKVTIVKGAHLEVK